MTKGHDGTGRPDDEAAHPHHVPAVEAAARRASLWTRSGRGGILARTGRLEYDRVLFFSDAIFAIAITLLIVDLPGHLGQAEPAGFSSAHALHEAVPGIIGFWIGFAVIGLFWMGHHSLFRYVTGFNRRLMLLNLLFVGQIAFLPYPTALLSAGSSQRAAVVFYAACTGAAGLVETVMWAYACRARDGLITGLRPATQQLILLRTARAPAVFVLSIPIALISPPAAQYFWLAILVAGALVERFYGHHDPGAEPDSGEIPDPP
jgi:uncharacterized membrane protein